MRKIFQFLNKHKIEILLCLFLGTVIFYTSFLYFLPFKSFGDIWAHLASVVDLQNPLSQIGDPFFQTGIKDPHYGPYLVAVALISKFTHVDYIIVMAIAGILSVMFLYLGALKAYYSFYPERKKYSIDKFVLVIAVFLLWESAKISYAGYYSLADSAITSLFPHLFAVGLFLFGISMIIGNFEYQSKFEVVKKTLAKKYVYLTLITTTILLTHIITGVIFLYSYFVIGVYYFFTKPTLRRQWKLFLTNILVPISALLLGLLWPYYNLLAPFIDLQTVNTVQPLVSIFDIGSWFAVAGIAFLGLIQAIRTKNKLTVFWFLSLAFIVVSYLYPIRISSYWRFFPIMLIPLFFLLTEWLSGLNKVIRTFILFFLIVFGLNSFINKVDTIGYRPPILEKNFSFLNVVQKGQLIFSDPETSYFIPGLTDHPVLAVTQDHWNPDNEVVALERYDDSTAFWISNSQVGSIYVIKKYNIQYVLINKKIYSNFGEYAVLLGSNFETREMYQDSTYLLLQIINQ